MLLADTILWVIWRMFRDLHICHFKLWLSVLSFGGWSEMLIEGDRQGLWQMMESTIKYEYDIGMTPYLFWSYIRYSTSLVLEHMPWIMPYFRLLIKARIKESPMLGHSEHKMNQRIKDGATSRDLFYYLVRTFSAACRLSLSLCVLE